MSENPRNNFVQALVLAQGLAEHPPQRDKRTKDPTAVGVPLGFENAQHVIPAEESAERQAAIAGKLVSDDAKVPTWHFDSPSLWGEPHRETQL